MADMNEMLRQLMQNPQAMAQVQSLAQDPDALRFMQEFLQMSKGPDPQEAALLEALKPFVRPDRAKRLDRAMELARMSQLAKTALHTLPSFLKDR